MSLSIAPLLIHSDDVPVLARRALRAAYRVPPDERAPHLEAAARSLYRETGLDCDDARELVGLSEAGSCG